MLKSKNSRIIKYTALSMIMASALVFINTDSTAKKSKKLKKLYISSVKARSGISYSLADKVKKGLKLTIFEKYGTKYQVLDDDAVKVMYKQAAKIMASGCDDKSCVTQIAEGINADEIIYGNISKDGLKLNLYLTNLRRRGLSLATKSIVDVSFLESQIDHFIAEAAKKLMNRKYRINKKAEISFDDMISLKAIKVSKVKGLDISVMKFKSSDETISRILSYLKELVAEGDVHYESKDYNSAREQYFLVLEKIKTKLRPKKQKEMGGFIKGVSKRIASSCVMEYSRDIELFDHELKAQKRADIAALEGFVGRYNGVLEKIDNMGKAYRKPLSKLKKAVLGRIDSIYIAIAGHHEKNGDTAYREYRFDDAIGAYSSGKAIAGKLTVRKKRKILAKKYTKKIETASTTGESYLFNRVKSLLDQAEYYNIRDEIDDAKEALKKAKTAIAGSDLANREVKAAYNALAKVMGEQAIGVLLWIRKGSAGGHIFYDKGSYSNGWRYLEAAPEDQSAEAEWGCYGTKITGADGTAIGTGKQNTIDIVKSCEKSNIAARICINYRGGGKSDWFLPSKDELCLMYNTLKANAVGDFTDDFYWSSSKGDADYAWLQYFSSGSQSKHYRTYVIRVRAIRTY